jgi:hypothetical protein
MRRTYVLHAPLISLAGGRDTQNTDASPSQIISSTFYPFLQPTRHCLHYE